MLKEFFNHREIVLRETSFGNIYYDVEIEKEWDVQFDITKAKELLLEVKMVCDKYKLPFFLIYGTALGAYRDKNFIFHDYDIDLGIYKKDTTILQKVLDELVQNYDYRVYKISELEESVGIVKDHTPIEFGIYSKINRYYTFDSQKVNRIKATFLENLEYITFLDESFLIPNNIEEYLDFQYGKDWRVEIKDFYNPYQRYISRPIARVLSIFLSSQKSKLFADTVAESVRKVYQSIKS